MVKCEKRNCKKWIFDFSLKAVISENTELASLFEMNINLVVSSFQLIYMNFRSKLFTFLSNISLNAPIKGILYADDLSARTALL